MDLQNFHTTLPCVSRPWEKEQKISSDSPVMKEILEHFTDLQTFPSQMMCKKLTEYEQGMEMFLEKCGVMLQPDVLGDDETLLSLFAKNLSVFMEVIQLYHICVTQFATSFEFRPCDITAMVGSARMLSCFMGKQESGSIHELQELMCLLHKICEMQKDFQTFVFNDPDSDREKYLEMQSVIRLVATLMKKPSVEERVDHCNIIGNALAAHAMPNMNKPVHSDTLNKMLCDFAETAAELMKLAPLFQPNIDILRTACAFRRASMCLGCSTMVARHEVKKATEVESKELLTQIMQFMNTNIEHTDILLAKIPSEHRMEVARVAAASYGRGHTSTR